MYFFFLLSVMFNIPVSHFWVKRFFYITNEHTSFPGHDTDMLSNGILKTLHFSFLYF